MINAIMSDPVNAKLVAEAFSVAAGIVTSVVATFVFPLALDPVATKVFVVP